MIDVFKQCKEAIDYVRVQALSFDLRGANILVDTFQAVRDLPSSKLLIQSAHGPFPIHQLVHGLGANAAVNVGMELNLGQSYTKVDEICGGSHEEEDLGWCGKACGKGVLKKVEDNVAAE